MHALKKGLINVDKFATFWMFPKRFYHSFVFQMTVNIIHCTVEAAERKYTYAISKHMKMCESG